MKMDNEEERICNVEIDDIGKDGKDSKELILNSSNSATVLNSSFISFIVKF